MTHPHTGFRWSQVAGFSAAAICISVASTARAENHALIMWIGEYANPDANLPGIDLDARNARKIALAMGIPEKNIVEAMNKQLTLKGMADAINALTQRIQPDDKVFLYYSGHGAQTTNTEIGEKCSEGLVAQDIRLYFDRDLETDLARLATKASQVVMMNDSCFSGGASEKGLPKKGELRLVPKALPVPIRATATGAATDPNYRCGDAVNKGFLTKNLEVVPRKGAQLLYIAAAADNEVSYATSQGSIATQAWAACIADPATDTDHSGSVSGEELRICAQARLNGGPQREHQTITLTGNRALAVSFASITPRPSVASSGGPKPPPATLNGPKALEDIRAGSDASYSIKLISARTTLHIAQDFFDFSVETNRDGYLYLLQVGTDGKTFNLLFPNKVDADNKIAAGVHRFPRASWALRSAGPAGTNHLMAIVSSVPKDFGIGMDRSGTFASATATPQATKSLVVVATGANAGGNGRYGSSAVVPVQEAP